MHLTLSTSRNATSFAISTIRPTGVRAVFEQHLWWITLAVASAVLLGGLVSFVTLCAAYQVHQRSLRDVLREVGDGERDVGGDAERQQQQQQNAQRRGSAINVLAGYNVDAQKPKEDPFFSSYPWRKHSMTPTTESSENAGQQRRVPSTPASTGREGETSDAFSGVAARQTSASPSQGDQSDDRQRQAHREADPFAKGSQRRVSGSCCGSDAALDGVAASSSTTNKRHFTPNVMIKKENSSLFIRVSRPPPMPNDSSYTTVYGQRQLPLRLAGNSAFLATPSYQISETRCQPPWTTCADMTSFRFPSSTPAESHEGHRGVGGGINAFTNRRCHVDVAPQRHGEGYSENTGAAPLRWKGCALALNTSNSSSLPTPTGGSLSGRGSGGFARRRRSSMVEIVTPKTESLLCGEIGVADFERDRGSVQATSCALLPNDMSSSINNNNNSHHHHHHHGASLGFLPLQDEREASLCSLFSALEHNQIAQRGGGGGEEEVEMVNVNNTGGLEYDSNTISGSSGEDDRGDNELQQQLQEEDGEGEGSDEGVEDVCKNPTTTTTTRPVPDPYTFNEMDLSGAYLGGMLSFFK